MVCENCFMWRVQCKVVGGRGMKNLMTVVVADAVYSNIIEKDVSLRGCS